MWSQLYMEITVQSVKVVETNNFLMYMMHDAVVESSVKARGLVTLYMCFPVMYTLSPLYHT